MKKLLVITGGGDCAGLNAVIRAIVKRAEIEGGWEVYGSIDSFAGLMRDPQEVVRLDKKAVAGIHIKGGTIIGSSNKGDPFHWPTKQPDGSFRLEDHSDRLLGLIEEGGYHAVISIGGDGSQRISQRLFEKGLNVVGVPKTIDNDLSATDCTFGFQTAVQVATESFDKLVSTAESHNRVIIMEVMGRDAGWIALHTAVAGGAEICLLPEIPYRVDYVLKAIEKRYEHGHGFVNIVMAESAKPIGGSVVSSETGELGYAHQHLGGCAYILADQLKAAECQADIRVTSLGHLQRGGTPVAFDRVLAAQFGVKAFEMVLEGKFGRMSAYRNNDIVDASLLEATAEYHVVDNQNYLLHTARKTGICFGDE